MAISGNCKDSFDTATATTTGNKSINFDPNAINLVNLKDKLYSVYQYSAPYCVRKYEG